ncbi:hypothetical protein EDB80DRAFT_141990 [Ilyonectria destructans]|nr:hypothetical protein EDB80DRAFT_141990 [Ilyonectria destructans]
MTAREKNYRVSLSTVLISSLAFPSPVHSRHLKNPLLQRSPSRTLPCTVVLQCKSLLPYTRTLAIADLDRPPPSYHSPPRNLTPHAQHIFHIHHQRKSCPNFLCRYLRILDLDFLLAAVSTSHQIHMAVSCGSAHHLLSLSWLSLLDLDLDQGLLVSVSHRPILPFPSSIFTFSLAAVPYCRWSKRRDQRTYKRTQARSIIHPAGQDDANHPFTLVSPNPS